MHDVRLPAAAFSLAAPPSLFTRREIRLAFILISVIGAFALILSMAAPAQKRLPDRTRAIRLNNLGVAYLNRGRVAEGLESFRQAFSSDPSLFSARLNEGIALLNIQRLAEARDVLSDATLRQPESARAWYNVGIVYRNLGLTEAAVEAFERVARIDPGDADTLYFLGQVRTQARRFEQAIAAYERCLALDPLHVSAEFGLARAYQL